MARIRIDTLPKELIAHIACCSDAESALRLSVTCKTIRDACYDGLVFKQILLNHQCQFWTLRSLDIQAISERASNDAETWARYALADEVICELSKRECPLEIPRRFVNCLPELFTVKHTFMYHESWRRFPRKPPDQKSSQIFCLAMAVLASENPMSQVLESLRMQEELYLSRDDSMRGFLWALCTIALMLRGAIRTRLAAWPYNNNANVPHIEFPTADQIPLRPLNDSYRLPLPFSRRAVELLGRSTSSFSGWDSWYDQHNATFAQNLSNFTEGTWCGYYVHHGIDAQWLDPPMIDIRFDIQGFSSGTNWSRLGTGSVTLEALNCRDGLDTFDIDGTLSFRDREVAFVGSKDYHNSNTRWDWDLRVTPFGLVGYWGHRQVEDGRISRYGIVWLWKKQWTESVERFDLNDVKQSLSAVE